jgi:hypothetical protein
LSPQTETVVEVWTEMEFWPRGILQMEFPEVIERELTHPAAVEIGVEEE